MEAKLRTLFEQGTLASYIIDDAFTKKQQSILLADYAATVKLVDGLREMIVGWRNDTPEQRGARFQEMEQAARDARMTEGGLEGLHQQSDAYWGPKMAAMRMERDQALHQLRQINIKANLAFGGICLAIIILVPSLAVLLWRLQTDKWPR